MSSQVIVDIFGNIVSRVSAIVTPQLQVINPAIVGINYLYGPPLEIVGILTQWTKSETFEPKKYPLIALFLPFPENMGDQVSYSVDDIRMIIAGLTLQDAHTADRYSKNIKPILYPIYNELMNQFYLEPRISSVKGKIKHIKTDWPFWDDGKDKNPFNDMLDVIEIKNMKLNIRSKNC